MGKECIDTKEKADRLFEEMAGFRFRTFEDMEEWFRERLHGTYEALSIVESEANLEIEEEKKQGGDLGDYVADGTFGEKRFGFAYADFSVFYIRDNADLMYVTSVSWQSFMQNGSITAP
ncbi:MAG: hypothetical protein NC088_09810 [Bacteroides sp.]|nr:hypothetical protein [Bacteroides sp.]